MTPEELFLSRLESIKKVIRAVCRRSRFSQQDCEDFRSRMMIKLVRNDYKVFREYRGESKIRTYLTRVISREGLDFCDHLWGKWRPSQVARRLGKVAEDRGDLTTALEWAARTHGLASEHQLPALVQAKSHLATLRDKYGVENFTSWWQGFTGGDPPGDLDLDNNEDV